ncbi:MAG: response regulator [Candidatus Wallbacteria bacterium]|nr:response regulator [Candidatus Wallbacteria bacterium]
MDQGTSRALLIEPSVQDAGLVAQWLQARESPGDRVFDVRVASSLAEGLERVRSERFDVVLLDLSLPDSQGLDGFRRLHSAAPDEPVVLLSGEAEKELAHAALTEGAQDYLEKRLLDSGVLGRLVRNAIERHRLLAACRRMARQAVERELRVRGVMERLRVGFSRLAAGDLTVRVSGDGQDSSDAEELTGLLSSFDTTVGHLDELQNVNAQLRTMAAHDMRSPLASAMLALSQLSDPKMEPQKRALLEQMMRRNLRKVLSLIDTLLDYFVLTSGEIQLALEEVDLAEVATQCARDLEALASERRQKIETEIVPGDPCVTADRLKLVRVLDNLLGNAIKYSSEDDTLAIRVEPAADEVRVEVVDHGPGIPRDDQGLIFERFRRASHVDRTVRGSGLGLAICRDYVTAHGGRIWVESIRGDGSRFAIAIPRKGRASGS